MTPEKQVAAISIINERLFVFIGVKKKDG